MKSLVNANYYNNILYSGIRYFSLFIDDPNTGGIPISSGLGWYLQNQNFSYHFPNGYHSKFKYQLDNLKSYWNDINGFQEVTSDFLNSGNIAKFGLSTGYTKYDGEPIKHPLALFCNSASEMEIPEGQELTYPDQSNLANSLRFSLDVRNNGIANNSEYYLPIHGILMGQSDFCQINENVFKSLDLGISLSIPIKKMERNRFVNNKIGIQITPQRIFDNPLTTAPEYIQGFLQFNCNYFATENTTQEVGLKVENGVQAIDIGGTNASGSNTPGANLWPTADGIDRSTTPVDEEDNEIDVNQGWQSPSNWTSILNENSGTTNLVRYHRFKNEFVGTVSSPPLVDRDYSVSGIKAYTSANNFTPPAGSNAYLRVCDNTQIVGTVYFPVPLIGSDRGPIKADELKNIEVSVQPERVDIRSRGNSTISQVQVVDLLGRTIVIYSDINAAAFKLPLNQLKNGTYIIQVLDSERKPYTSKIQR